MDPTVLLVGVVMIFVVDAIIAWCSRKPSRWRKARHGDGGTTDPETVERHLTAGLFARSLDPPTYRTRMAAIAAAQYEDADVWRVMTLGSGARQLLGPLCVALPELSPATVRAAVQLVHHGATAQHLTRLLGLTEAQARRISAVAPGDTDHRG